MLLKFFTLTDSEFSDHMVKYIMDTFIEMSISKVYITTAITAIVIAIATSTTTTFPNVAVFATPFFAPGGNDTTTDTITTPPTAEQQQQQQQTIHITKDGTNSYVISGGSSSVGSFDTTYRVLGERSVIRASEDLIISTITDDFSSSPTIGYVRAANMTTTAGGTADAATLPNPFATSEQITERITSELRRVITEAENNTTQGQHVEIKCDFGMTLDDMRCHYIPLLEAGAGGSIATTPTNTTDTTGTGTTGG
jgi:DNA-binding beta-propeller fold protein YncE